MKKIRLLGIFIGILAVLLISAPALAYAPTAHIYDVSGIEIFAGIHSGGNTYGATFVPLVTSTDGSSGILRASINYKGEGPNGTAGYNDILGGNWTLTITKGPVTGTIIGCIGSGTQIVWSPSYTTDVGNVTLDLFIIGGTGGFTHITKGLLSTFVGADNHVAGPKIGSITIPIVYGKLNLNY